MKEYDRLIKGIKNCMFNYQGNVVVVTDFNAFVLMLSSTLNKSADDIIKDLYVEKLPELHID